MTQTIPQKPHKIMLVILAFISAFPPLSTDLYLPALPQMVELFNTTAAQVNLTLSLFFICFAVGILIWGPLSEKYGRKPILYCGLSIYVTASILCGLSETVNQLILFRIFQAFGGGAATAVATAVVKDLYSGKERAHVLAMVMAMVIIAPVVAPMFGSILLKFFSWRAIFFTLAGFGVTAFLITLPLKDPLKHRYQGSTLRSIGRLFVVLRNPGFTLLLGLFSTMAMPLMAFVASSSFIYINGFHLSEEEFSLFFAANSLCAMLGPILYIKISHRFSQNRIITTSYLALGLSGLAVIFLGHLSPYVFALTMMPATLAITSMRAPGANLMLEQQDEDTGSASALINFFGMIMGSVGMLMVSSAGHHLILAIGLIQVIIGGLGTLAWAVLKNKHFIVQPQ